MLIKNTTILILICLLTSGCSNKIKGDDGDGLKRVHIIRFDRDFFSYITNPSVATADSLSAKYPRLLPAIAITAADAQIENNPSEAVNILTEYYSHPALMQVYKDALTKFDNTSDYEKELSEIQNNVSAQLPGKQLPRLSFHISGFKENVIAIDSIISISTDKYMGSDYALYSTYFKEYEQQQMHPAYILRDYLKAWLISDIITNKQDDLLEAMIYQGKILYLLNQFTGKTYYTEGDIIGYSTSQLDWCKANEKRIWKTMVEQAGLNNRDRLIIAGYINDAPYTIPAGKESPGRVGCWVGWQIVSQYAAKKDASLQDVLQTDVLTILKQAKYNP